jgi:hypothetical protein
VSITAAEINSPMGYCKILNFRREQNTFTVNVECSGPDRNQLVAKVRFTLRADETIDFADEDENYRAVLHRCP